MFKAQPFTTRLTFLASDRPEAQQARERLRGWAADLRAMSLWQLAAYIDGFNRARDPDAADAPTPQEEDALWAWIRDASDEGSA